jgi:hypothetical protein
VLLTTLSPIASTVCRICCSAVATTGDTRSSSPSVARTRRSMGISEMSA